MLSWLIAKDILDKDLTNDIKPLSWNQSAEKKKKKYKYMLFNSVFIACFIG